MTRVVTAAVLVTGFILVGSEMAPPRADPIQFRSVLDGAPLELALQPNETETEAVKEFKATGRNLYAGQEPALSTGKSLYQANCQVCHQADGTGKVGPSLVGEEHIYPRVATDVGMFEVIYGGASGVMPSWSKQGMTQDQMLRVIAYVRSLRKR